MDIKQHRVPSSLEEVFYIPEFVSEAEEEYLLRKINESSAVKWKTLPNRRLQIWGGELTNSNVLIPRAMPQFITEYPDLIRRLRNTGVFSKSKHGEPNHIIVNEYLPGQGIMPHEDGPSYHPVVATLSLGSHAVFHYHRYVEEEEPAQPEISTSTPDLKGNSRGKPIDLSPVFSLLLEPRSLVITAKSLYTNHLHSIDPIERDLFNTDEGSDNDGDGRRRIANVDMLKDEQIRRAVKEGGVFERGPRVSLTCRDVEKVVGGTLKMNGPFGRR
ncbi:hypothetical protein M422DRAFT_75676 [Sphaerobolus stellatus SS14]|uniref:Fe2OG dioxygenase domain-containing protein n=1 Tax=Sphaerobolus stellatus (strain SS14) TaxID=990650 RepID=A0A0C9VI54_SPHS4|nr:hypothetical protein M422DRAFT_75676 [Sphaerobolus stellatus SS14]